MADRLQTRAQQRVQFMAIADLTGRDGTDTFIILTVDRQEIHNNRETQWREQVHERERVRERVREFVGERKKERATERERDREIM